MPEAWPGGREDRERARAGGMETEREREIEREGEREGERAGEGGRESDRESEGEREREGEKERERGRGTGIRVEDSTCSGRIATSAVLYSPPQRESCGTRISRTPV